MADRTSMTPFGFVVQEDDTAARESMTPFGVVIADTNVAAGAAANPKGPLGMPLHGPFGGPLSV